MTDKEFSSDPSGDTAGAEWEQTLVRLRAALAEVPSGQTAAAAFEGFLEEAELQGFQRQGARQQ